MQPRIIFIPLIIIFISLIILVIFVMARKKHESLPTYKNTIILNIDLEKKRLKITGNIKYKNVLLPHFLKATGISIFKWITIADFIKIFNKNDQVILSDVFNNQQKNSKLNMIVENEKESYYLTLLIEEIENKNFLGTLKWSLQNPNLAKIKTSELDEQYIAILKKSPNDLLYLKMNPHYIGSINSLTNKLAAFLATKNASDVLSLNLLSNTSAVFLEVPASLNKIQQELIFKKINDNNDALLRFVEKVVYIPKNLIANIKNHNKFECLISYLDQYNFNTQEQRHFVQNEMLKQEEYTKFENKYQLGLKAIKRDLHFEEIDIFNSKNELVDLKLISPVMITRKRTKNFISNFANTNLINKLEMALLNKFLLASVEEKNYERIMCISEPNFVSLNDNLIKKISTQFPNVIQAITINSIDSSTYLIKRFNTLASRGVKMALKVSEFSNQIREIINESEFKYLIISKQMITKLTNSRNWLELNLLIKACEQHDKKIPIIYEITNQNDNVQLMQIKYSDTMYIKVE